MLLVVGATSNEGFSSTEYNFYSKIRFLQHFYRMLIMLLLAKDTYAVPINKLFSDTVLA